MLRLSIQGPGIGSLPSGKNHSRIVVGSIPPHVILMGHQLSCQVVTDISAMQIRAALLQEELVVLYWNTCDI